MPRARRKEAGNLELKAHELTERYLAAGATAEAALRRAWGEASTGKGGPVRTAKGGRLLPKSKQLRKPNSERIRHQRKGTKTAYRQPAASRRGGKKR